VKAHAGKVREDDYNVPTTIYGANKLYCEHLGRYYARHFKQLAAEVMSGKVDFRCIRFPGLISAETVPSGGTSDYAPEMIHAAAAGQPYACFVRPDTRIPFMAMPDAVDAIFRLMEAPRAQLSRTVYNIGAFAPSAAEVAEVVRSAFPGPTSQRVWTRSGRGSSIRGRPTWTTGGPGRLGARPGVRVRRGVRRVPDPDDPKRYSAG
jgi:nucleoside-diphosphate-sugar epimerase